MFSPIRLFRPFAQPFRDGLKSARLDGANRPIKYLVGNLTITGPLRAVRRNPLCMRPLTVITGIVLGSCLSITVSLGAVLLMFLLLGDKYPRLSAEFGGLLGSLLVFLLMTGISAVSFYALLKGHPWRFWAQALMWAGLAVTGYYYWP